MFLFKSTIIFQLVCLILLSNETRQLRAQDTKNEEVPNKGINEQSYDLKIADVKDYKSNGEIEITSFDNPWETTITEDTTTWETANTEGTTTTTWETTTTEGTTTTTWETTSTEGTTTKTWETTTEDASTTTTWEAPTTETTTGTPWVNKTTTTTTSTTKTTSIVSAPSSSHFIKFSNSMVIVWEKCGIRARTSVTQIFGSVLSDGNTLKLWFDPSINSLLFETQSNGTSTQSVVSIATNVIDTLFFVFNEHGKVQIYVDCPSISRMRLSWTSDHLKHLTDIELFVNTEGFVNLDSALSTYMCRAIVSILPGSTIHFSGQFSSLTGTLIFSFFTQNLLFSVSHVNGSLQIISSDGQTVVISINKPISSSGFYLVFLANQLQVFVNCPYKQTLAGSWSTTLFYQKLQIETSRIHNIGNVGSNLMLQSFCTTSNLINIINSNVTSCIPINDMSYDVQTIGKGNEYSSVFLPDKSQEEKIEYFRSLNSFNFAYLMRPVHRILIASRLNAKPRFFDRSIVEYREGFTDGQDNFWLGLDLMNQVTTSYNYKLRVEFIYGSQILAEEYLTFKVGNLNEKFTLTVATLTSGQTAYFAYHSAKEFSTFNFGSQQALARRFIGGSWYMPSGTNYFCFTCESGVDETGSFHTNYIFNNSYQTRTIRLYLIP